MENKLDKIIRFIKNYDGPPIRLMEVCGTHTRQISHFGIQSLLPPNISLISGPGCPVCVTPAGFIDRAAELSMRPGCTALSFGDMMRVPGRETSLLQAKAAGGSVMLIYSPSDVLTYAKKEPGRLFYVAAVGFETTLPSYALLVRKLADENIKNVRLFTAVKALVPALERLCRNSPQINGFIGPGHVSAVIGCGGYEPLCEKYGIPLAVAGFGYEHLIAAVADLIRQAGRGTSEVHNLYPNAVSRQGNIDALELIGKFFVREPSVWRGLGEIEASGYSLAHGYADFDAGIDLGQDEAEPDGCLCGEVITGRARPAECCHFGKTCTPEHPLGPCMASEEGACGIYRESWYGNQG
ncbi:MAG: hydrogenase formation protein HypD [Oscillospiraceae bacterium]|nr:hydrogenase formation protein HypD [Oscillospiraceae bacterium]